VVDQRVGGRGGRRRAAGVDDRLATLLDGGQELALEPGPVGDDLRRGAAADAGVLEVRDHRRRVVAPHREVGDLRHRHAGLLRELGLRAVLVQTDHRGEALARDPPALLAAISALVLAGLPTTATRRSSAAAAARARP
jgi:hypothetical protein